MPNGKNGTFLHLSINSLNYYYMFVIYSFVMQRYKKNKKIQD